MPGAVVWVNIMASPCPGGAVRLCALPELLAGTPIDLADCNDLHFAKAQQVAHLRPPRSLEADGAEADPCGGCGAGRVAQGAAGEDLGGSDGGQSCLSEERSK